MFFLIKDVFSYFMQLQVSLFSIILHIFHYKTSTFNFIML